MKAWLAVVAMASCVGCSTYAPSRAERVEIPIVTPCRVEPVVCGPYALDQVSEADRLITKGRAALAEVKQREACEVRLRAALLTCTGSPR